MTSYFVTFMAYIDERKRPENFPKVIHFSAMIHAENQEQLGGQVNLLLFQNFVQPQGVGVRRDPYKTEEVGKQDLNDRMWIPMHMITHIIPVVKMIVGEVPFLNNETAKAELPSGEGIVQQ